jgi:hypothetical protein
MITKNRFIKILSLAVLINLAQPAQAMSWSWMTSLFNQIKTGSSSILTKLQENKTLIGIAAIAGMGLLHLYASAARKKTNTPVNQKSTSYITQNRNQADVNNAPDTKAINHQDSHTEELSDYLNSEDYLITLMYRLKKRIKKEEPSDYLNSENVAQDIVAESPVEIGDKRYFVKSQVLECNKQRFDFKKREVIDLNTQTIISKKADMFRWYVLKNYQTITQKELKIIEEWATTQKYINTILKNLSLCLKKE